LLTGCASGNGRISLERIGSSIPDNQRNFLLDFPNAYLANSTVGEYDIILINDSLHTDAPAAKGPLQPTMASPVTQVLKLHIFWRPEAAVMIREATVTNAIIDYYVLGNSDIGGSDFLHYQGAAFVTLSFGGKIASILIKDGELELARRIGNIVDPIGHSVINGTITAVHDDHRTEEMLATLQRQVAAAEKGPATLPADHVRP
jgi:hypothetical protein